MLRRNVRLRREYLYRKSLEAEETQLSAAKRSLEETLATDKPLHTSLRSRLATRLMEKVDLDDQEHFHGKVSHIDDEYAFAATSDPKLLITTCRDPSSRLQQFAKELNLIFPTAVRVNRGGYVLSDLKNLCEANSVTDLLVLHEHRGQPDGLIVSHLPLGPTAYFSVSDVVLRHDLPSRPPNMSLVLPHLLFHNFSSALGRRVQDILRYLFPPSNPLGKRCITFANHLDLIHFRHHTWGDDASGEDGEGSQEFRDADQSGRRAKVMKREGEVQLQEKVRNDVNEKGASKGGDGSEKRMKKKGISLTEVGPRFALRLYRIELGTLEMKNVETEWALRPFMNKQKAALSA